MIDQQAQNAIRIRVYLATLLLAVPGSYLATEIHGGLGPDRLSGATRLVFVVVALGLLFVGSQLARTAAAHILRLHTRRLNKSPAEPRRVLIVFLSDGPARASEATEADWEKVVLPARPKLAWNLPQDLAAMAEYKRECKLADERPVFWRWEQALRGVHHNRRKGKLERLILICSRESIVQAHWFTRILERYKITECVRVELLVKDGHGSRLLATSEGPLEGHFGWNFEDFDDMWRALSQLLDWLGRHEKVPDRDIDIDLTGGPKPATVVAASATIHRDLRNQYVCTNPRDPQAEPWEYEVLDYDLVLGGSGGLM